MAHCLVITDLGPDGLDLEVEHSPECPVSVNLLGGVEYTCPIGMELLHSGFDSFDPAPDSLLPGRYEIEHWASHQPSTPNGPAEWDSGVTVIVPGDDA